MSAKMLTVTVPQNTVPQMPSPQLSQAESTSPNGSFRHNPYGTDCCFEEQKMNSSFVLTPPASPLPAPPAVPPAMQIPTSLAGVVQSTCTTPVHASLPMMNNPYGEMTYAQSNVSACSSMPASPHPSQQVQNFSFGLNTAQSGNGSFSSMPSLHNMSLPMFPGHVGGSSGNAVGSPVQQQAPAQQGLLSTAAAVSPTMKSTDSSTMSLSAGVLSMASGSPDSSVPPSPTENSSQGATPNHGQGTAAQVQPLPQSITRQLAPQTQPQQLPQPSAAQVQAHAQAQAQAQLTKEQRKAQRASISSTGSAGRLLPPLAYEVRVQHKHGRCNTYINSKQLTAGQHVIVDGDRGLDLGMVIECKGVAALEGAKKNNKVKREATEEEVRTWREGLVSDEAKAMKFIQHQIARHSIPITVHRAEFQFDRKKLTFHYTTEASHPDFRCILKDGYRQFRCRIWLNNCNPKGSDPGQALPITEAQAAQQ